MRILVNGAYGRMGTLAVETITKQARMILVGRASKTDHLGNMITQTKPDIVIDFTLPQCVFDNTKVILMHGARPIIGTTGLSGAQVETLQALAQEQGLGGAIIPNFSLGAAVLNKCGELAAHYFNHMEVIEMHHDQKRDAPSGTALQTAELLAKAREKACEPREERETLAHVRGGMFEGIPIHSVRLPGILAKQTVYLGGPGETLSLTHEVINRDAYMPGLLLACERVPHLDKLVYGLACLLD